MGLSRLEVNLRRLLAKCELMVKDKFRDEEKIKRSIDSLNNMLLELEKTDDLENVGDYTRRINILKNTITAHEKSEANSNDSFMDGENIPIPRALSPREELLGKDANLRLRTSKSADDLDELLEYNKNMQNKIADDMLILTRNLKEQSQLASNIIKQDTELMNKSSSLTERNLLKLKAESEKLQEHSKRAWKCWMWILLLIVMVVFINMVLFMKVMKKKT